MAKVVFDSAGNLYGTTARGGNRSDDGVVFELTKNQGSWSETILHNFAGSDGGIPESEVTFDGAGNMYGTTTSGGNGNIGTVFELSPAGLGWNEKVIVSFNNDGHGYGPIAGLLLDSSGNLFWRYRLANTASVIQLVFSVIFGTSITCIRSMVHS